VRFGLLRPRRHLGEVVVDGRLEFLEVRRAGGDLARVVCRLALGHPVELLRDAEQLVVVGGRELAALGAEPDQLLHVLGQVRDVLVLKQHLVADRIPQRLVRRLAGLDLGAVRRAGRGVIAPIDLLHQGRLLIGAGLREEVLAARVGAGDLACIVDVDALARGCGAAHALQQRHLDADLDGAIGRSVVVLDVVPLRAHRRDAEHLEVRGGLELLAGHLSGDRDLERHVRALLRLARAALDRRAARGIRGQALRVGPFERLEVRADRRRALVGVGRCLRLRGAVLDGRDRRGGVCRVGIAMLLRWRSARGLRAELVGFVLERRIGVRRRTSDLGVHGHATLRLLDHVRELVAEQLQALRAGGIVGARREEQVGAARERARADRLGVRAGVDAHRGEVAAERGLHLRAHAGRQRCASAAGRRWSHDSHVVVRGAAHLDRNELLGERALVGLGRLRCVRAEAELDQRHLADRRLLGGRFRLAPARAVFLPGEPVVVLRHAYLPSDRASWPELTKRQASAWRQGQASGVSLVPARADERPRSSRSAPWVARAAGPGPPGGRRGLRRRG